MEKVLGKNQSFAREINYELVVALLKDKPYSATQLADKLQLSNATLSSIVKELLKLNLIKIDSSSSVIGYGRKQVFYTINDAYGLLLVVNISHNSAHVLLTNVKEEIIEQTMFERSVSNDEVLIEAKRIFAKHEKRGELKNIILSVSGLVDINNPSDDKKALLDAFNKAFKDVPSFLTNDGDLFAYAELSKGKLKDVKDALFVYLNYGIGGSLIINNEMFKGDNGVAGEFGCLYTDNDGEIESLEDVASLRVLKANAEKVVGKEIKMEELYPLFNENEKIKEIILNSASQVGKALRSVINVLDIGYVVINGAVSNFGDEYLAKIEEETSKTFRPCKIEFSTLGKRGVNIGGVSLGVDYILKKSLKRS